MKPGTAALSVNLALCLLATTLSVHVPALYPYPWFVQAGGLKSYGPDSAELYQRAAIYVDKILKGANPVGLPVEQPTKLDLLINLKTAKALELTIPQSLFMRADEVIE